MNKEKRNRYGIKFMLYSTVSFLVVDLLLYILLINEEGGQYSLINGEGLFMILQFIIIPIYLMFFLIGLGWWASTKLHN